MKCINVLPRHYVIIRLASISLKMSNENAIAGLEAVGENKR